MKHFLIIALSFFSLSLLGACQTFEGMQEDIASFDLSKFTTASSVSATDTNADFLIDGDCPKIELVDELSTLHDFTDARKPSEPTRISTVTIKDAISTCTYGERSVTVDLKLDLNGEIGPAGRENASEKPFFSHSYFVAVTTAGGSILAKEVFDAAMTYEPGENTRNYTETLRQIIPADSRAQGSRIKVVVGFQLTQDQLAYNRALIQRREETRRAFEAQQEALKKKITPLKTTTAEIEAMEIEALAIETPAIETLVIQSPKAEIKTPEIQKPEIQAPVINTPAPDIYIPDIPQGTEVQTQTFNRAGPIDITVP